LLLCLNTGHLNLHGRLIAAALLLSAHFLEASFKGRNPVAQVL